MNAEIRFGISVAPPGHQPIKMRLRNFIEYLVLSGVLGAWPSTRAHSQVNSAHVRPQIKYTMILNSPSITHQPNVGSKR